MIQPDHIIKLGGRLQPADPPGKIVLFVTIPAIQGVAPKLAIRAESIRGHTCHRFRTKLGGQAEHFRVCPNFHAVQGYIDGHIPNNSDTLILGIGLQLFPLPVEKILAEAVILDLFLQILPGLPQSIRIPALQRLLPGIPGRAVVLCLQGHIKGVIPQPVAVFPKEANIGLLHLKTGECQPEDLIPVVINRFVIYLGRVVTPVKGIDFFLGDIFTLHEPVQIDKIGIAGKSRAGLVGRVTVAGGRKGQDLPVFLACSFQKIHKPVGFLAQSADSVGAGQRGNVHQNTTGAHNIAPLHQDM